MTLAHACVIAAFVLPYLLSFLWRWPSYSLAINRAPREFEERLDGWRRRAHWAHLNGLEVFAPFAAAVIIAHQFGAPQARIDALAVAFVGFRLAHAGCYLADLGVARSIAFAGGFACTLALYFSATA